MNISEFNDLLEDIQAKENKLKEAGQKNTLMIKRMYLQTLIEWGKV